MGTDDCGQRALDVSSHGFLVLHLRRGATAGFALNRFRHGRGSGHLERAVGAGVTAAILRVLFPQALLEEPEPWHQEVRTYRAPRAQLDANSCGCGVNVECRISVQVCHHPNYGGVLGAELSNTDSLQNRRVCRIALWWEAFCAPSMSTTNRAGLVSVVTR